jgi:hypothetical protein
MDYEHRPYLVQRLMEREPSSDVAPSVFRSFRADRMGAAEFERGILGEALVQACKKARTEQWKTLRLE